MRAIITYLFIGLVFYSCNRPDQKSTLESFNKADTLLKACVEKTFNKHGENWNREFKIYLTLYNKDSDEKTIYPGQYKMKYFAFSDGQQYAPFAVRFSTVDDSLLAHFSFADEYYYLYNSNRANWYINTNTIEFIESSLSDDHLIKLVNLESNLDMLIETLGYKKDKGAIINLINVLFHDMLQMERVNFNELEIIRTKFLNIKSNDERVIKCQREFENLFNNYYGSRYCFQSKEGTGGYWTFDLVKPNDEYHVNVEFIGDLIYFKLYM